jgi:hypothetical protein
MAAPKVIVSPIDAVMVEKTDWADPKSVDRYFATIGSQMTSGQVWANIATGYFKLGSAAKSNGANAAPDVTGPFNAYRKSAEKRTGKALTDKTADTYKSVGQTLATIGYNLPYDGATLNRFFAEKGSMVGGYGSRAAAFNTIAAHFKAEPTFEEIVEYAKTLKAPATLSDDLAPVVSGVTKMVEEDHAEVILGDDLLAELQVNLVNALSAFAERAAIVAPKTPRNSKGGKTLSPAAQALKAKRDAQATTH